MLACFAVTLFLFRHQDLDVGVWTTVLLTMLLVYLPFGIPAIGKFVHDRPRIVFWTGVAIAVGGIAAVFGMATLAAYYPAPGGITGRDPISMVVIWIIMSGVALTALPRSMAAFYRTQRAAAEVNPDKGHETEFDGLGEARTAALSVVRNWIPFARLMGPWILLLWAIPFVGLHVATYHNGISPNFFAPPVGTVNPMTELLGERLPAGLVFAFALPVTLVSWHRYILFGGKSAFKWSLPGDTLRYLWRLWMVAFLSSVLLRLAATNAPDVARLSGTKDTFLVTELLFWAVVCGMVYLGSVFALVFPATAAGNRTFAGTDSVRIAKPLGNSFRLGLVLSLLPFGLGCWGISALFYRIDLSGPRLSLLSYSLWLIPTTMTFLSLASCATYLSRVYAARTGQDNALSCPEVPVALSATS